MLAILLDLQGCVPDSEMVTQLATGLDEESIARRSMRHDQMYRERHLGRAHGPDVQVMPAGCARFFCCLELLRSAPVRRRNALAFAPLPRPSTLYFDL